VQGRLTTIQTEGQGASAFEVFETYESLMTGLGGVKVYEGDLNPIYDRKLEFADPTRRRDSRSSRALCAFESATGKRL
jgi:hypothetical protein